MVSIQQVICEEMGILTGLFHGSAQNAAVMLKGNIVRACLSWGTVTSNLQHYFHTCMYIELTMLGMAPVIPMLSTNSYRLVQCSYQSIRRTSTD